MSKEVSNKQEALTFPFNANEWMYIIQMSKAVDIKGENAMGHAQIQEKMNIVLEGLQKDGVQES